MKRSLTLGIMAAGLAVLLGASVAGAGQIKIHISGMNIGYDGTNVYDRGSADPDPLATVTFLNDDVVVGSVYTQPTDTPLALDLLVPNVTNIAASTTTTVLSGPNGDFKLHLPAPYGLDLTLGAASVTYVPATSQFQFVFAGSLASIDSIALPFGLSLVDPVTVSFSSQIDPGTLTTSGGIVTGFKASGTGEVAGVPEPSSLVLTLLGLIAIAGSAWLRQR